MVGTILDVMGKEEETYRAIAHGETAEGWEPASRAQIEQLEEEIGELKELILKQQRWLLHSVGVKY